MSLMFQDALRQQSSAEVILQLIHTYHLNVNSPFPDHTVPLNVALRSHCSAEVLRVLLTQLGRTFSRSRTRKRASLRLALHRGCEASVIELLLDHHACVQHSRFREDGSTPLTLALRNQCCCEVIQLLLDRRGSVSMNTPDWDGTTALGIALRSSLPTATIHLLLDYQVDVNAKSHEVYPLHCIVRYGGGGRIKILQLLLDYRADVRVRDENGWSTLHHAVFWSERMTPVRYLLHRQPGLGSSKADLTTADYRPSLTVIPSNSSVVDLAKANFFIREDELLQLVVEATKAQLLQQQEEEDSLVELCARRVVIGLLHQFHAFRKEVSTEQQDSGSSWYNGGSLRSVSQIKVKSE